MLRFLLLAALALLGSSPALAQNTTALVVGTCGTVSIPFKAGNAGPLTVDTTGKLCSSASGGGGTPGGSSGQLQFNNAGAFGGGAGTAWDDTNRALTITGATVTTSKPLLDLSQTWNTGANVPTAIKLNVTDTVSPDGSLLLDLQVGGVNKFNVNKIGSLAAAGSISAYSIGLWSASDSGGIFLGESSDVVLKRDAANTLALRNGANAQTFNIYNTYTDSSNYERGGLYWSGGAFTLGTQSAGTGGARAVQLISSSSVYVQTNGGSGPYWMFDTGGNLKAGVDGSYDIGASGDNRPRHAYLGGNVVSGGFVQAGSAAWVGFLSRTYWESPVDGNLALRNWAGSDFGLVQLGGTTSSYPAIKRNGAAINFRLADDSADAAITVSTVKTVGVTVANLPSAATAGAGARGYVTDATSCTFLGALTGGGSTKCPVVSDGTSWTGG